MPAARWLSLGYACRTGLVPSLVTGFVDDEVNHLVGVEDTREGALELVGLGPRGTAPDFDPTRWA